MSLTLYPAIDLKGGNCVRLLHGEMEAATQYNDDPAAQARTFLDAGFEWLHIVDLDGAFAGKPANAEAVEAIIKATDAKVQLGGGIRSMATVESWLGKGLSRVILGTAAVEDPNFVKEAARAFPGQIVVGIDARDGMVATEGWAETSGHTAVDIGKRFEDAGVAAIVYTDISRDGALTGVNVEGTAALAKELAIPVIASGGVASDADITALAPLPVEGVIIGRALYDGRLTAAQAFAALAR
jgi:phosphoribosylformimino-5-aminoimidazole carboxamide ribotide isomerase